MSKGKPRETLASQLDHMKWDYSPAKDRSFLLSSIERVFASVAWEIDPQHLTPVTDGTPAGPPERERREFETRPLTRLASKR